MKNILLVVLVSVFCSACATLPVKRQSVNAVITGTTASSVNPKDASGVEADRALAEADALIKGAREADKVVRTLPKNIDVSNSYGKYLDKMVDDTITKSKPAKSQKQRLKERRK